MFYVYIIYSVIKDRYYIGHTEDIEKRINEHIRKRNLGADDWELKYYEILQSRGDAMKREIEIKNKKRRSYIESLISSFNGY